MNTTSSNEGVHEEYSDQKTSAPGPTLPPVSRYLHLVHGGSHWHEQNSLKNIIVFGDSYSKYYGTETWVDHLQKLLQEPPKLHNYAVPGALTRAIKSQMERFFAQFPEMSAMSNGESNTSLDPDQTTYFIYLGINDCGGRGEQVLNRITTALFDALHELYVKAKARNFILIDVPPFERTPKVFDLRWVDRVEEDVTEWNKHLRNKATAFQNNAPDTTLLLFSSHAFFTDFLNLPSIYGFSSEDTKMPDGDIWFDDLHPTSKVHEILGKHIYVSIFEKGVDTELGSGMERYTLGHYSASDTLKNKRKSL